MRLRRHIERVIFRMIVMTILSGGAYALDYVSIYITKPGMIILGFIYTQNLVETGLLLICYMADRQTTTDTVPFMMFGFLIGSKLMYRFQGLIMDSPNDERAPLLEFSTGIPFMVGLGLAWRKPSLALGVIRGFAPRFVHNICCQVLGSTAFALALVGWSSGLLLGFVPGLFVRAEISLPVIGDSYEVSKALNSLIDRCLHCTIPRLRSIAAVRFSRTGYQLDNSSIAKHNQGNFQYEDMADPSKEIRLIKILPKDRDDYI